MYEEGGFLEGIEQLLGNFQVASAGTHVDVRLGDPVEIAATGHQHVQAFGQIEIFRRLSLRVRTIVDFDAAEAFGFGGGGMYPIGAAVSAISID